MDTVRKNQLALGLFMLINLMLFFTILKLNERDGYFILDVPTQLYYGKYGAIENLFFIKEERFFPLVYIVYILSANMLGNTPLIFMFVQILFFIGMVDIVIFLFWQYDKNLYRSILICLLFYITSPFAESYLSIGKQEWLLCFCIAIWSFSILMILLNSRKAIYIPLMLINVFSLICALLAKETGIILYAGVFVIFCGLCLSKQSKKKIGFLILISTLVIVTWLIYRKVFITKGEYTTYSLTIDAILKNIAYYLKYSFDVIILGVIGFATNTCYIRKEITKKSIYAMSMNLIGWGYLAGIVCWHNAFCYYLYPVAFFFIVSLIGSTQIVWKKIYVVITKTIAIMVLIPLVLYTYSASVLTQEAYNVYSDSIHYLLNNVPNGNNILFESFLYGKEPIYQTNLLFDVLDKEVNVFAKEENTINFACQTVEEVDYVPQKGDYIVVYSEQRDLGRPIRRVSPGVTYGNGISIFANNPRYDIICVNHKEYSSRYFRGLILNKSHAEYSIYYVQNIY